MIFSFAAGILIKICSNSEMLRCVEEQATCMHERYKDGELTSFKIQISIAHCTTNESLKRR